MGGGGGQPWDTPLVHPEHVRNLPFFKKLFHADFQGWKWFNTVTPRGDQGRRRLRMHLQVALAISLSPSVSWAT
jgi:hypothetical protein